MAFQEDFSSVLTEGEMLVGIAVEDSQKLLAEIDSGQIWQAFLLN